MYGTYVVHKCIQYIEEDIYRSICHSHQCTEHHSDTDLTRSHPRLYTQHTSRAAAAAADDDDDEEDDRIYG